MGKAELGAEGNQLEKAWVMRVASTLVMAWLQKEGIQEKSLQNNEVWQHPEQREERESLGGCQIFGFKGLEGWRCVSVRDKAWEGCPLRVGWAMMSQLWTCVSRDSETSH